MMSVNASVIEAVTKYARRAPMIRARSKNALPTKINIDETNADIPVMNSVLTASSRIP
jgi:hypothetical protein